MDGGDTRLHIIKMYMVCAHEGQLPEFNYVGAGIGKFCDERYLSFTKQAYKFVVLCNHWKIMTVYNEYEMGQEHPHAKELLVVSYLLPNMCKPLQGFTR